MRSFRAFAGALSIVLAACGGGGGSTTPGTDTGKTDLPGACSRSTDCDDGNLCTIDSCTDGQCRNVPKDCDDGNACTADSCSIGQCAHAAIAGCCRTVADCDDQNPCTQDACPAGQCTHSLPDPSCCLTADDCADADECTLDQCTSNKCVHTATHGPNCCEQDKDCIDGDPCTDDVCKAGKCVNTNNGCCSEDEECKDDNPCHVGKCSGGVCKYDWTAGCCVADGDCDDKNACTADACIQGKCAHTPVEACCSTDAECAVEDKCKVGTCEIPEGGGKGKCIVTLLDVPDCCVAEVLKVAFDDQQLDGFTVTDLYPGKSGPVWQPDTKRFTSAPASLYFGFPATHTYENGSNPVGARAVSPAVDLSSTLDPELVFRLWKKTESATGADALTVRIVTGAGEVDAWSSIGQADYTDTEAAFAETGGFAEVHVGLGAWAAQKSVAVAFVFDTLNSGWANAYEGAYVDDVRIVGKCQ